MARTSAPSPLLTTITALLVVAGSLGLAAMVVLASGVVDSTQRNPYADSGGPIVAVGAFMLFGWTPLPGAVASVVWSLRLGESLQLPNHSLRLLGEAVGVRPLLGWVARTVLRGLLIIAVLLIPYQFFADRNALPAVPTAGFQLLVLIIWTMTRVELMVRLSLRTRPPPAPR